MLLPTRSNAKHPACKGRYRGSTGRYNHPKLDRLKDHIVAVYNVKRIPVIVEIRNRKRFGTKTILNAQTKHYR
jgi:hypothetical protein